MVHCRIKRISDKDYCERRVLAFPIFEQWPAFGYARSRLGGDRKPLNLAEYYALMPVRFGKSGGLYDDWKGIFSFPFEVELLRDGFCHQYILNIVNWRSTVELRFCKTFTDDVRCDPQVYRRPIENEFSEQEMQFVDGFLYGSLLAFRERCDYSQVPDFVRKIEMQSVILGYRGGRFFEHFYEDNDEFWRAATSDPQLTPTAIRDEKWPDALERDWFVVESLQ